MINKSNLSKIVSFILKTGAVLAVLYLIALIAGLVYIALNAEDIPYTVGQILGEIEKGYKDAGK